MVDCEHCKTICLCDTNVILGIFDCSDKREKNIPFLTLSILRAEKN